MEKESDRYIIAQLKDDKSRERGASLLVNKYQERIYWYIRRMIISHEDSQDILQETFFNAYRYINGFKEESTLYTWLYKIATNECLKWMKKKRLNADKFDNEIINCKICEEALPESDEIIIKLQRAINVLPEKQKLVFNLRYYDELSYSEIAEILDCSVDTLKANYYYAEKKIIDFMTK